MAVLHDLDIKAEDALNVYVIRPNEEMIQTVLGPEFLDDCGKSAIIVKSLDGLKSVGESFRAHLAQCNRSWDMNTCG